LRKCLKGVVSLTLPPIKVPSNYLSICSDIAARE
jgi:hypothetical protein